MLIIINFSFYDTKANYNQVLIKKLVYVRTEDFTQKRLSFQKLMGYFGDSKSSSL